MQTDNYLTTCNVFIKTFRLHQFILNFYLFNRWKLSTHYVISVGQNIIKYVIRNFLSEIFFWIQISFVSIYRILSVINSTFISIFMRCFFLKVTILKYTIPLKKFHTFMLNYNESFEPSNIKNKYIILFKENNVFAIVLFFLVSIIEK